MEEVHGFDTKIDGFGEIEIERLTFIGRGDRSNGKRGNERVFTSVPVLSF